MNRFEILSRLFILILCFCVFKTSFCQDYNRKSLTLLMLEHSDEKPISSSYYNRLNVPARFDFNSIGEKFVSSGTYFNNGRDWGASEILQIVKDKRIANRILRSILIDESKKIMTTNVIEERGLYNASDSEFKMAKSSARGIDVLKDAGLKLMQGIYFLVIQPQSIESYYNSSLQANEYTFSGVSYLFNISLDSAYLSNKFWEDFYFDSPNTNKLNKLMNYDFPLEVTSISFSVPVSDVNTADKISSGVFSALSSLTKTENTYTTTKKSESEIITEAIDKILSQSLSSITSSDDFMVRGSIVSTNPIRVKIGTKESVRTNDLFIVKERYLDQKTDKIAYKHKGYVRAQWIAENRQMARGTSPMTTFYRVGSGKLEKGMLLEEANDEDYRWNMGFNYNMDSVSLMSGYFMNFEYLTKSIPGFSFAMDFGINPKLTSHDIVDDDDNVVPGSLTGFGFTSTYSFRQSFSIHRFSIVPTAGVLLSMMGFSEGTVMESGEYITKDIISEKYGTPIGITVGVLAGGDFCINLNKTIQFRAGVRMASGFRPFIFDLNSLGKSNTTSTPVFNEITGTYDDLYSDSKLSFPYKPKYSGKLIYSFGIRLFNI